MVDERMGTTGSGLLKMVVLVERLKTNSLFWEEMTKNLKNLVAIKKNLKIIPSLFSEGNEKQQGKTVEIIAEL